MAVGIMCQGHEPWWAGFMDRLRIGWQVVGGEGVGWLWGPGAMALRLGLVDRHRIGWHDVAMC